MHLSFNEEQPFCLARSTYSGILGATEHMIGKARNQTSLNRFQETNCLPAREALPYLATWNVLLSKESTRARIHDLLPWVPAKIASKSPRSLS